MKTTDSHQEGNRGLTPITENAICREEEKSATPKTAERQKRNRGQIPIQDKNADADKHPPTKLGSDPNSAQQAKEMPPKLGSEPNFHLTQIEEILSHIADPEIPVVSIRELGILRNISELNGEFQITITPTYSGCPAMGQIEDDIQAALAKAGIKARLLTQLAPAWTTDWMSDEAKEKLRAYGIAPPHTLAAGAARPIRFSAKRQGTEAAIPCPQCGSRNTTETSHFGSTACKALYKCLACLEPFDYFKPY